MLRRLEFQIANFGLYLIFALIKEIDMVLIKFAENPDKNNAFLFYFFAVENNITLMIFFAILFLFNKILYIRYFYAFNICKLF